MTFLIALSFILGALNFAMMGLLISDKSPLWVINLIAGTHYFYVGISSLM